MVAKTFQGLEDVLRDELIELGAENVELGLRMVSFEGDNEILYRANLCCRTALRILKPIVMFTADSTDELYDHVRELDWEEFLNPDSTFSIDSTVNGPEFTHSKFATYRVKDGIVDHFYDKYGKRPSIRLSGADVQLNVHISDNRVTISLDSSGEPLYKRGYRVGQTEAPINEVLAAGIILKTGWRGESDFIDPMCGSGTFLVEAALIACNINPGIYRDHFAFEKWPDFDSELFEEIYNDDSGERDFAYTIYGGDIDADAVAIARKNVKSARVEDNVKIERKDVGDWVDNAPEGIMVTNPPYGERLKPENISILYNKIGSTLKKYFKGWHAWIIGYREDQFSEIGLKPSVKIPLHNGSLECSLREYVMFDGKYSEFKADGGIIKEKDGLQGPKKVKRISDDEWEKEAGKFNRSGGMKPKDKRKFNRDDRKPLRRDDDRDFRRDDRKPLRRDDDRDFRRDDRKPFRRDNDRDFRRDDRKPFRRDNDRDFRRDDRKPFRRDDDRGFRHDDRKPFRRDERSVSGSRSSELKIPAKSKGPSLPEDSQTIINPVHMRSRKNRNQDSYDE